MNLMNIVLKQINSDQLISHHFMREIFVFAEMHTYQLRAYIFSARDLLPADQNGLSGIFKFSAKHF